MKIREHIGILKGMMITLTAGLFLGVLFAIIWKEGIQHHITSLDMIFVKNLESVKIGSWEFFFFALEKHIKSYLLIWIFSLTIFSKLYQVGYLLYKSILAGFSVTVSILLYGGKGVLLSVAYCMPQGLIYVPIFMYTIIHCFHFHCETRQAMYAGNSLTWRWYMKESMTFLLCGIAIVLGCYLESYVGVIFVDKVIAIFFN